MTATIISTFVGVLAGGLIPYLVSSHYYEHASEDLRRESEKLRGYSLITLRVLQAFSGGHGFTIRYDEQGEPVGVDYRVTLADQIPVGDHVEPKINPPGEEGG
jgi:hypothetical protein